ncbi:hypothetical protein, partial [Segatella sp.]
KQILRIQPVFTYFKRLFSVPKWVSFSGGSPFFLFLTTEISEKSSGEGLPVLYYVKQLSDKRS